MSVPNMARFGGAMVKKIMFTVFFYSKSNSEKLFHNMSVPNMACFAVAMVKKIMSTVAMVANGHP